MSPTRAEKDLVHLRIVLNMRIQVKSMYLQYIQTVYICLQPVCMRTHTNLPTCLPTYPPTYRPTYVLPTPSYRQCITYVRTYVYVRTYIHTFVHTYIHICIRHVPACACTRPKPKQPSRASHISPSGSSSSSVPCTRNPAKRRPKYPDGLVQYM